MLDLASCPTFALFRTNTDCLTDVVCMCCLNSSIVVFEMLMSLNIPSSFEVNWQPHSVCGEEKHNSWNCWQRLRQGGRETKGEMTRENRFKGDAYTSVSKPPSLLPWALRSCSSLNRLRHSCCWEVCGPDAACSTFQTRPSPAWTWTTPWPCQGSTPLPVLSAGETGRERMMQCTRHKGSCRVEIY